jgi:hypothetical protein
MVYAYPLHSLRKRSSAHRQYVMDLSQPTQRRPSSWAATSVLPEPQKALVGGVVGADAGLLSSLIALLLLPLFYLPLFS